MLCITGRASPGTSHLFSSVYPEFLRRRNAADSLGVAEHTATVLHPSIEDTNAFHGKQVMSGVGVIIYAAKECSCRIFSDVLCQEMTTARVLVKKAADIVDIPTDEDEWSILGLFLERFPGDNRKIIRILGPDEGILLSSQAFQLHGQFAFAHFVIGERLKMGSEPNPLHHSDEPFGGVILIPFDSISEVHRELVMEVMITFTNGHESGDDVVARCMLVIKWRIPKPMSEGIDAESAMVNES